MHAIENIFKWIIWKKGALTSYYEMFADSTKYNGWRAFNQEAILFIDVKIHPSINIWMCIL